MEVFAPLLAHADTLFNQKEGKEIGRLNYICNLRNVILLLITYIWKINKQRYDREREVLLLLMYI